MKEVVPGRDVPWPGRYAAAIYGVVDPELDALERALRADLGSDVKTLRSLAIQIRPPPTAPADVVEQAAAAPVRRLTAFAGSRCGLVPQRG